MTNPYITKLNELIADINENEIASHDNPKSLKGWCERWREEATMCSIALYEAKIEQNPSGDAISRKIISAFLSGLISDETERKKALQYINELPPVNPQPCEDTISRQAAIDLIADYDLSMGQVVNRIYALPPVTPQPKTGHWITKDGKEQGYDIAGIKTWYIQIMCSECGFIKTAIEGRTVQYHYCPSCGAKMVEPQEGDKCSKCKYHINPDYTRCKECGAERSDKK